MKDTGDEQSFKSTSSKPQDDDNSTDSNYKEIATTPKVDAAPEDGDDEYQIVPQANDNEIQEEMDDEDQYDQVTVQYHDYDNLSLKIDSEEDIDSEKEEDDDTRKFLESRLAKLKRTRDKAQAEDGAFIDNQVKEMQKFIEENFQNFDEDNEDIKDNTTPPCEVLVPMTQQPAAAFFAGEGEGKDTENMKPAAKTTTLAVRPRITRAAKRTLRDREKPKAPPVAAHPNAMALVATRSSDSNEEPATKRKATTTRKRRA